jgi:hypothetical protein
LPTRTRLSGACSAGLGGRPGAARHVAAGHRATGRFLALVVVDIINGFSISLLLAVIYRQLMGQRPC